MNQHRLSRRTLISYGLGSSAPTAAHEFCAAFLLIYYTDVIRLDPIWVGYAFFIRMLIDAAVDPAIGFLSDRTQLKAGRRRPYFVAGSLPGMFCLCIAFFPPSGSTVIQFAYLVLVSSVMVVCLSLTEIPHMAMSYEMTPDYDERVRVIGYRNFVEAVTSFIAILSVPVVTGFAGSSLFGHVLERQDCYVIAAVLIAVAGIVTSLLSYAGTSEARAVAHQCQYDFRDAMKAALRNRPFLILLAMTALIIVANRVSMAQIFLLLEHFHGKPEDQTVGILTAYFAGCLGSMPLWIICGTRFDKNRILCVALATWPLSYFAVAAQLWSDAMLCGIAFAMGASLTGIIAMMGAIAPEILDVDRTQSGLRREGLFASISNIVSQAGLGIGYLVVGLILQTIGYRGGEQQTADVVTGLRISTAFFPLAASVGALAAFCFFPIRRNDHDPAPNDIEVSVAVARSSASNASTLKT